MRTRDFRVTHARLLEVLDYNPETGVFVWKIRPSMKVFPGDKAGALQEGRVVICVDKVPFSANRLAWFYVHGEWPRHEVDHINGIPSDNRIANLRDVPRTINMQNQRRSQGPTASGFLGVSPANNKWKAEIFVNGKSRYLGRYETPEEAHEVYVKAKRVLHPGCTI